MNIEVKGLCKRFSRLVSDGETKGRRSSRKEEFLAVDHVDLSTRQGEILGVLGPNGAGKTTLLRMMGTLLAPDEGTVSVVGEDGAVISDPIAVKSCIGYLSENTHLYGRFSTRELLHTISSIYGLTPEVRDERIEQITEVLNLSAFIDNRIERLSTGQTQRANIARCLIHSPGIYIFDEPTLGLDIISSESIVSFMKGEREQGRTVLYSTHYMEEAQYLCDRIVMLWEGRIIAEDTPQRLMEQTATDNLRDCFRALLDAGTRERAEETEVRKEEGQDA
ncbi:MAG: ABC transporter ATP-binding protein [Lachnospiraceae bacterium]|nr:ABC transporter ATP-binding protein [Lachnospiraceae bacterium]